MNVETLLARAGILLDQHRYKQAENYLIEALSIDPANDRTFGLLARCYLNNNFIEKGMHAIDRAIAINPHVSFYHYLKGLGYDKQNDLPAAAASFIEAIRLDPGSAGYFGSLAYIYLKEDYMELALEKANAGLAIDPGNVTCLNARSIASRELGRRLDASIAIENAFGKDPQNWITHYNYAWQQLQSGKNKAAKAHFLEALRINPQFLEAKGGLLEAIKANFFLYRWAMRFRFWLSVNGRKNLGIIVCVQFVVFLILLMTAVFENSIEGVVLALIGAIGFINVLLWIIDLLATLTLLFYDAGRRTLTTVKCLSVVVASVLFFGGALLVASSFSDVLNSISKERSLFLPGLICVSLAPLFLQLEYPIRIKGEGWRQQLKISVLAGGVICLLCFMLAPVAFIPLFICYVAGMFVYNYPKDIFE